MQNTNNGNGIVLVANAKGILVCALQIKNNSIVQAKLNFNKPVKNDAEINRLVHTWAKDAELSINTTDLILSESHIKNDLAA